MLSPECHPHIQGFASVNEKPRPYFVLVAFAYQSVSERDILRTQLCKFPTFRHPSFVLPLFLALMNLFK
jgi:hypothetical protein